MCYCSKILKIINSKGLEVWLRGEHYVQQVQTSASQNMSTRVEQNVLGP